LVGSDATFHGLPFVDSTGPALRLTVQRGPNEGQVIECRRLVTLVGSRPGCKIRLDHPLVSPLHAAIINDGTEVHAVDLVTHRGTRLNDLKMEYERLSDGDVLTIEPWAFGIGLGRTKSSRNNRTPSIALEFAPSVIALEHLESGRVLQPNRAACTVGRRSGCDIQVDDAGVSRAHALLFLHGDHPVVVDLLSRNGTFVNDEPTPFRILKDQDVVRVGNTQFRVRVLVPSTSVPKSKDARDVAPHDIASSPPRKNGMNGSPVQLEDDLIDIQSVEGSQRWQIAEKIKQTAPKRRVAQ